jgi:2',3'-cyclic-nucleotide 3'-phosphodiesterase
MRNVVIMRGLPGSGKSTVAKKLAATVEGAVIVSADDGLMVGGQYQFDVTKLGAAHGACQEAFKNALAFNKPLVIVDNTNTTPQEIQRYMDMAQNFGYEAVVMVVPCDVDTSAARNTHGVPREAIERMASRMASIPLDSSWRVERSE